MHGYKKDGECIHVDIAIEKGLDMEMEMIYQNTHARMHTLSTIIHLVSIY